MILEYLDSWQGQLYGLEINANDNIDIWTIRGVQTANNEIPMLLVQCHFIIVFTFMKIICAIKEKKWGWWTWVELTLPKCIFLNLTLFGYPIICLLDWIFYLPGWISSGNSK